MERIEHPAPPWRASSPEVVYTSSPHSSVHLAAWREMVQELWSSRELTWRLFLRDFSARYRQSVFGYLWAVLPALLTAGTFLWLTQSRVLTVSATTLPYPVFVLLGLTVWQLFAGGVTGATQSLTNAGTLIAKINFPRETLVLAAFGQALFEFLLRLLLVAIAFALCRVAPSGTILFLPLAMLPLCLFTLGLGFLLALANGVMRDVGQMLMVALTFWMFLTPVVYPAPVSGSRALLNVVNPISPFVIAAQDLAGRGHLTQPGNYAIACVISLLLFLLGWRVFHVTEPRIAERAG
ncbi:MAG TPA: ABC transporter permease [Chthonomonadaceae bacterium]|nr:ABC transporter permease [Chthonomonadaceae bacterium]